MLYEVYTSPGPGSHVYMDPSIDYRGCRLDTCNNALTKVRVNPDQNIFSRVEVGPNQYILYVFQWIISSQSVLIQYKVSIC